MRSAVLCLIVLLGADLPGIAGDRCDWEVDFLIPPAGSFRVEAVLVPGISGAEVLAGPRGEQANLRIGLDPTGAARPDDGGFAIPCAPGRTYRVTIVCVEQAERGWDAWVRVDEAAGGTLFLGRMALQGRPDSGRVRAAEVLGLGLAEGA